MAKTTLQEIDKLANLYNKTKDDKYKIKWYQLVKEFADGRTSALSSSIITKVRWDNDKRSLRVCKTHDIT
tara:strand:+ start:27 stop:236 length:210 start_codon:yes stop_codon:yes gene_type:complete